MTARVPSRRCVQCGYKLDSVTAAYGDYKPKAGDASICAACGALAIIEPDLTLRAPTPDEAAFLERQQRIIDAQVARAHMLGDTLKPKRRRRGR
jgi:hypothetical protein